MERTEYFNDTRPTQTQLNNTEDSKVNAILRRQRATAQLGTVLGFQTTPNAVDPTLIDIGPGEGYTGGMYTRLHVRGETSSERIASDTSMIVGQALFDYANGAKNYVSLVVAETTDTPLTEIDYPFVAYDTLVHEAYTVSVISETDWNLLTLTQLRLRILISIVTANGAGVPLTAAAIQQVVQPKNLPMPTQPVNITGIAVNNVADTTSIGSGTLRWEVATRKLFWTAPGDTEGIGVAIPTSGSYTIYSANTTYWIVVYAVSASLPVTNQTDIIYIQSMYGTTFPRYSAMDSVHREMLGTGIPSLHNPHATSLSDISGLGFDHAALFHANGISLQASTLQLSGYINTDPLYDEVLVINLGGRLNSFLIAGNTYTDVHGVSSGATAVVSFDTSPPATGEYMIYLDDAAGIQKISIGTALWTTTICLVDIRNLTAGAGAVITWNATAKTLTYAAPGDVAGTPVYLMGYDNLSGYYGYYKLYSSTLTNWVIVYVNGGLGGNNSTTFTTGKSELINPDNSILKLCVVHWDLPSETLSNIRDIRQWGTSDWRDKILEEHDANGRHTKVLREPLRAIVQTGPTFSAYAVISPAVAAGAPNTAVYGLGDTAIGVMGSATTIGVRGLATTVGVYGVASNTAAQFSAATQVGILALASASVAGSFSAPNFAVIVTASGDNAINASAQNYTIVATASAAHAIHASAPYTALAASASVAQAIWASAPNTAIEAHATTAQAINASAPNYAIYATVATQNAVYARAGDSYAANISAPLTAMHVSASNAAAYMAAQNNVIYAIAATECGLYASASKSAIKAVATSQAIWCSASANAIVASGNNEVIGCGAATATAFIATAPNYAIVAHATSAMAVSASADSYAIWAQATASYAIVAEAWGDCAAYFGAGTAPIHLDAPLVVSAGYAIESFIKINVGPLTAATWCLLPLYNGVAP